MNGSDFIKVYPDIFSDDLCDKLVDLYQRYPEYVGAGRTMGGFSKVKKSLDFMMKDLLEQTDSNDSELIEETLRAFDEAKELYLDDLPFMESSTDFHLRPEYPKLKRYIQGIGNYKPHIDVGPLGHSRQIVVIAYLNTVEEGGDTYFPLQDVSVKPVKGSVLAFPPFWTYPHQAMKAVSGDKFMVSTFYHGE